MIECHCICTCCSTQVFLLPDAAADEAIHCPFCGRRVTTRKLQPFCEAEWLACTDPLVLTQWEGPPATGRKVRLFACACCRLLWDRLAEPGSRVAVEVAERFADGLATEGELTAAYERALAISSRTDSWFDPATAAAQAVGGQPSSSHAARVVVSARGADRSRVLALFRDVIGNPFRPPAVRAFPAHVGGLARACYDAFPAVSEEYAVLGDALEELGETEAGTHCREPLHARGCHVLDWILGKA
jgi:hypothetical protein